MFSLFSEILLIYNGNYLIATLIIQPVWLIHMDFKKELLFGLQVLLWRPFN